MFPLQPLLAPSLPRRQDFCFFFRCARVGRVPVACAEAREGAEFREEEGGEGGEEGAVEEEGAEHAGVGHQCGDPSAVHTVRIEDHAIPHHQPFAFGVKFPARVILFRRNRGPDLIPAPPSVHRPALVPRPAAFRHPVHRAEAGASFHFEDLRLRVLRAGEGLDRVGSEPERCAAVDAHTKILPGGEIGGIGRVLDGMVACKRFHGCVPLSCFLPFPQGGVGGFVHLGASLGCYSQTGAWI